MEVKNMVIWSNGDEYKLTGKKEVLYGGVFYEAIPSNEKAVKRIQLIAERAVKHQIKLNEKYIIPDQEEK